ncbi:MAG: flagellar M-ring protein FliF [Gemmatimonadaceae bacterium]|nr:flagellar M-ring protein FliF [Gemmatimonadaceae bacterium]
MNPLFESITSRFGGPRQTAIVAIGLMVAAGVYYVSQWATRPVMVPLFANVPVESVKAMTDKLQESGITFELDQAGTTIMVQSKDVARARVDLAAGEMPNAGRPGLELFDKPSWGMTDFTQKVNYRRALEGELERTIGKMQNVKTVQVHLALEDDQMFKQNERPSKASVTLSMANGNTPAAETVQGIASLVAASVGGLTPEHVTVVDERGRALTMQDEGSVAGLTSRQLAVQKEVEGHMEAKANDLLSSLVGTGNARVQVSASMNFNKVERTTQAVDPERQAILNEQKSEVAPSTPQQGAGYTQSVVTYENTKSVETFSGAIGNVQKLTVAVLVADKATFAAPDSAGNVPDPVITPRTPAELAQIESLVRTALGVDSTRGDMVSVVSAPFDMPKPVVAKADTTPVPQDMIGRIQSNPKPVVAIAAIVALMIVALVMVFVLRPKKSKQIAAAQTNALAAGTQYAELPASAQMQAALQSGAHSMEQEEMIDEAALLEEQRRAIRLPPPPTTPEREQAIATVEQRPDAALRVTRNWLRQ